MLATSRDWEKNQEYSVVNPFQFLLCTSRPFLFFLQCFVAEVVGVGELISNQLEIKVSARDSTSNGQIFSKSIITSRS